MAKSTSKTASKTTSKSKKKPSEPVKHNLIPKHQKLSEKDKKALLEKHNISLSQLPRIYLTDPALAGLNVEPGDVIKITRSSPTAGETIFYRVVING